MRRWVEGVRFFFISFEFLLIIVGWVVYFVFFDETRNLISLVRIPDELFKWVVAIPGALLVWSFISGRKVLFPDRDKKNVLQRWPDYWKLRMCFHVSLMWNFIFLLISIFSWFDDWKNPVPKNFIALIVSVLGAAMCSLSIYNAQTMVEEATSRLSGE